MSFQDGQSQRTINITGAAIGFAIVFMLGASIWALVYKQVPQENQNALMVLIGALTTNVTAIVGFYFGSSSSNKAKDTAIANLSANTVPPGPTGASL